MPEAKDWVQGSREARSTCGKLDRGPHATPLPRVTATAHSPGGETTSLPDGRRRLLRGPPGAQPHPGPLRPRPAPWPGCAECTWHQDVGPPGSLAPRALQTGRRTQRYTALPGAWLARAPRRTPGP